MKREQFLNTLYDLTCATNIILFVENGQSKLETVLKGMGFDQDKLVKIMNFISENVTDDEFNSLVEKKAFISYIDCLDEIQKYMLVAEGYQEMKDINLTISKEDHHLEEEGARFYEMDSQETENGDQAG